MATEGRDYFVTVTVELADGEPRNAGEYGWSRGTRIRVYDWGCPSAIWLPKSILNSLKTFMWDAVLAEKKYKQSNKLWRRIFKRG